MLNAGSGEMTPPRSLGRSRSGRSAAAGVAYAHTTDSYLIHRIRG